MLNDQVVIQHDLSLENQNTGNDILSFLEKNWIWILAALIIFEILKKK